MGTYKAKRSTLSTNLSKENLPEIEDHHLKQNPLDNVLILENIFTILKESNNAKCLGKYRRVCKSWDREIAKLVRKETEINLLRILKPYPNGMGWTAKNNCFEYEVPYPEVSAFRNIVLGFRPSEIFDASDASDSDDHHTSENGNDHGDADENNSKSINDTKLQNSTGAQMKKWFQLMGSDVRSLCISVYCIRSSNRVIERVLKEWCPNLESLTLIGVNVDALLLSSGFTDLGKSIICSGLKTLQIEEKPLPFHDPDEDHPELPKYSPNIGFNITQFNRFIYQHGIPGNNAVFPQICNDSGVKVVVPKKDIFSGRNFPDLSKYFPHEFFPQNHDGGIFGQLMKSTRIENLILYSLQLNFNHIASLFHYRPNKWRGSLKYLEFEGNHPLQNLDSLIILAKLECPISTLTFPDLHIQDENENEKMTRFLSSVPGTLEHLTFSGKSIRHGYEVGRIVLPELPKLKTFVHNNICISGLSATHLFESAPNLEKCYLKGHRFCDNLAKDTFFQVEKVFQSESMKTFKFWDYITSGEQACNILAWFPNLESLELDVMDNHGNLVEFIAKLGDSKINHLKLNWESRSHDNRNMDGNAVIIREMKKLKKLVYLELHHFSDKPCYLKKSAFGEGFGELPELIVLKLENFGIYTDEELEIKNCLSYIPVVEFIRTKYLRRLSTRRR